VKVEGALMRIVRNNTFTLHEIRIAQPLARQLQNPVALFPTDNNGVLIQLPAVAAGGAVTVAGTMIFGIGTQSDNALGAARVLTVDANGNLSTSYGSQSYGGSYIDSGSNGNFFLDTRTTGLPLCTVSPDFYCPATLQAQSATIRGINGASSAVAFNVGNLDTLNGRFNAFNEVAGPNPGGFAWSVVLLRTDDLHGDRRTVDAWRSRSVFRVLNLSFLHKKHRDRSRGSPTMVG
jgi:hypothetical protein